MFVCVSGALVGAFRRCVLAGSKRPLAWYVLSYVQYVVADEEKQAKLSGGSGNLEGGGGHGSHGGAIFPTKTPFQKGFGERLPALAAGSPLEQCPLKALRTRSCTIAGWHDAR